MAEVTPLYVYSPSRPNPEQMEILKKAKQASGVDTPVSLARAIAGCGRCLSFSGRPDFLCEWAETSWDDPKLAKKIAWVLTGEGGSPYRWIDWFQAIHPDFKEVS